jgi:hypothetical protein
VEDLDPLEAELRRVLDYLLDRILLGPEVPIRIGLHGERDA